MKNPYNPETEPASHKWFEEKQPAEQNDTNAALLPATPTSEGKGETVEQAAKKYSRKSNMMPVNIVNIWEIDAFKQGAQWQSQHSQSLDIRKVLEYVSHNISEIFMKSDTLRGQKQDILAMQPEIEKMLKEK